MKTKLTLTGFGSTFGTLRFDEESFSHKQLDFTPNLDYEPTNAIHADNPSVYTSDKSLSLCKFEKIHLKYDVIHGSIVGGLRQPNTF